MGMEQPATHVSREDGTEGSEGPEDKNSRYIKGLPHDVIIYDVTIHLYRGRRLMIDNISITERLTTVF